MNRFRCLSTIGLEYILTTAIFINFQPQTLAPSSSPMRLLRLNVTQNTFLSDYSTYTELILKNRHQFIFVTFSIVFF